MVPFWNYVINCSKFCDMVSVCLLMSPVSIFLVTGTLVNAMSRIFHKLCTESFDILAKDCGFSRFLDVALWIRENTQQQSCHIYDLWQHLTARNDVVCMIYNNKIENYFIHWETTKFKLCLFMCSFHIITNLKHFIKKKTCGKL